MGLSQKIQCCRSVNSPFSSNVESGFLIPLSGGADSAAVAAIVHVMSTLVTRAANGGDQLVMSQLKRILGLSDTEFSTAVQTNLVTNCLLHTVYMGTENSTSATHSRAASLASEISSYHKSFNIDTVVTSVGLVFSCH